jgi:gliding motility-associated-like protein
MGIKEIHQFKCSNFDRYGKLIIELNAANYSWEKFNSNLPADDYWYHLKLDNTSEKRSFYIKEIN